MSETEILLSELKDHVLTLTLNRPKANAFNFELIAALAHALKKANINSTVRCIVLTGSGKIFSAGQDLREFKPGEDIPIRYHLLRTYNPLILQIRQLEKPILAAINGTVSGAALGIALACDLRIASDLARFVVGFSGIGLAPDSAVSLLLPALIGLGRATEFAFTNAEITVEQALTWGLVNRTVPDAELSDQAFEWAKQLSLGPVRAMGLAKRTFNKAVLGNLEQALDYEAYIQDIAGHNPEHQEGVLAFLEKRLPNFPKLHSDKRQI